ncbi:MAG: cytochrome bc complex cytochrome b subunit [Planctomycetes bacterium]|nr:cytochrome bc complex cytochrome b subunit [Planctomycetota bacterium]
MELEPAVTSAPPTAAPTAEAPAQAPAKLEPPGAPGSRLRRLYEWADERLGLTELRKFAAKKTVPEHRHAFWYYWGGISLFLFIVQVLTGVLLLVYFRPGPEAYDSVRRITYEIHFGWLVRSAHSWSANLMVFAVFVHMFSAGLMKAYRKPREFTWWSGVVLLLLTLGFGFSGYLLTWDEVAYFGTKVGIEVAEKTPVLGRPYANLLRGGPDVNENTLQRFFALHVVIFPLLFMPVLVLHLWLVSKHGNAVPPSEEAKPAARRKSVPFFPNFMMKDLAMWLIALNVIAIFASFFPWQLGSQADPLKPAPVGIHPEWYFMSSFQVLKIFGDWFPGAAGEMFGMAVFTLGLGLWFLLPLFDPSSKNGRRARLATYFILFALAVLVVTTVWGYLAL